MPFKISSRRLVSAAVLLVGCRAALPAQGPYRVLDRWKIGGAGGWDYLVADAAAHRLYVTHGQRVEVVDTTSGKVIGAITGFKGTHGVVLEPGGKVGYVSDGGGNSVAVFDQTSFAVLTTIPAGTNPDGMTWEPTTRTVWAFNGRSSDVSVIDSEGRKVIATTKLPGKPEFPQADGKGNVFVNIEDKNVIVRLDATSHAMTATWPLEGCESPSGMAIDKAAHRLFSVCDGQKMVVLDTETGKQLATATIGEGPDAAGFSPQHHLAFSSNGGDGTLSVVDTAAGYKTVQTLATQKGARTMSYDDVMDRVYVVTAEFGPRPAATPSAPRPRPSVVPDSFTVLVVGR